MIFIRVLFVQTYMQCFICNALSNDLDVLPANMKLGFVSDGNCTKLPVDLCCMKFKHRLKIPKKQTCMPNQNNVGAKPVHRNVLSTHKLFCYGFFKTHGTFGCDLQNRFEENAKIMRYCRAKFNVISDVLCDGESGVSKTITNC